jgi:two-component system response regulator MprA
MEPVPHIAIVDDHRDIRDLVGKYLAQHGYRISVAESAAALRRLLECGAPDLIVLDVMMPNLDGLTVCRRLRSSGDRTPVLMLTARHEIGDRVAGLDAGADDYLVKPYSLDELLARVRALLRRLAVDDGEPVLRVGNLSLDPRRRHVTRGERVLELTKTEFDLLELLMRNAGIVLTRDQIYSQIWGYDFETSSKSLDVYVSYLRRKTEEDGEPRLVHTVRGVGYTARAS